LLKCEEKNAKVKFIEDTILYAQRAQLYEIAPKVAKCKKLVKKWGILLILYTGIEIYCLVYVVSKWNFAKMFKVCLVLLSLPLGYIFSRWYHHKKSIRELEYLKAQLEAQTEGKGHLTADQMANDRNRIRDQKAPAK